MRRKVAYARLLTGPLVFAENFMEKRKFVTTDTTIWLRKSNFTLESGQKSHDVWHIFFLILFLLYSIPWNRGRWHYGPEEYRDQNVQWMFRLELFGWNHTENMEEMTQNSENLRSSKARNRSTLTNIMDKLTKCQQKLCKWLRQNHEQMKMTTTVCTLVLTC